MADERHGFLTVKLLVMLYARTGRGSYRVETHLKDDGAPDHVVCNLVGTAIYANNTQEEAKVICGLCNLLNDADWGTLQPYVDELLPGKRVIPNGVQA